MKLTNKNILTFVAAGFLFVALLSGLPYGYFTLMRFVVCAVGVYLAYKTYEENEESLWPWMFGFVAVLFNPILPIHLERGQWEVIDLVAGTFLVASIFLTKSEREKEILTPSARKLIKKVILWVGFMLTLGVLNGVVNFMLN